MWSLCTTRSPGDLEQAEARVRATQATGNQGMKKVLDLVLETHDVENLNKYAPGWNMSHEQA